MSQFVLLPWEHPFSGRSSKPHATTKLKVGGKLRNFVLKIHDGNLYFKEPARGQVFVVFDEFAPELARDSIGLVSRWQSHVADGNYGALVTKRDYFPKLTVRAQILMAFHSGGSGWTKEHFDPQWFMLPEEKAAPLDIWNDTELEFHARERFPIVQRHLINRALTPEILATDPPRWLDESGERIAELLIAAATLFVPSDDYWNQPDLRLFKVKSHSAFAKGDVEGPWLKHAQHSPKFRQLRELLEPRIQFVGVQWSEGGEHLEHYSRQRNEKIFEAGLAKWGELWRGNWAPQRASFKVEIPDTTHVTAHDKMEAALTLHAWLQGKMGEAEIAELLRY